MTFTNHRKKFPLAICLILFFHIAPAPTADAQIIASPVIDPTNNQIGAVQLFVMRASKTIREDILPMKEGISKVQEFFKKTKQTINLVIVNLKIIDDIIDVEKKINKLHDRYQDRINASTDLTEKWRYRVLIGQLYWQSRNIFEVFETAMEDGYTVIDDEGRINILQQTKKRARLMLRKMKMAARDVNKEIYSVRRTRRELETFNFLFKND